MKKIIMKKKKKDVMYFDTLTMNKYSKYCLPVEIDGYRDLGVLIYSLISISQKSLYLNEDKLEDNIRIDIYNLLDLANKLIPFSELEFLDKIKDNN